MNPSSRWLVREEGRGEREGTYRRGPGGMNRQNWEKTDEGRRK